MPPRVSRPPVWAGAGLLVLLNLFVCSRLFHTEYLPHMNSIEGAYFGISRFILENPRDLTWFSWWYGGIPFQNAYPPLFHVLVAGLAGLAGISPALAHHALGAVVYCLAPVTLLFLAYALSGEFALSFGAALMYSVVSPAAFVMPSVLRDTGSLCHARRLEALVVYGDAPHLCALMLLPLAILALHRALERWHPLAAIAAVVLFAAVAVTNWIGAFSLALAVISYLAARFEIRRVGITALLGLLAYGLAMPWIPPSTIAAIRYNAQYTVGYFPLGGTQLGYGAAVLAAGVGLWWLLARVHASLTIRFASFFLLLTASLALTAEFLNVSLMPQADRYQIEMEMAICLLTAFTLGPALRRYGIWLAAVLLVASAIQAVNYRRYAGVIIRGFDVRQAVEYQTSRWLGEHLPGGRVFATGSTQFWMSAFSDTAELGGGFGQGVVNPEIPVLQYGIPYTEKDGADAAMWLRLLGADALIVSGPRTRDAYPGIWHDPDKFRGVLPELWRNGDDAIYGVPRRSRSLAHVIGSSDVVRIRPMNGTKVWLVRALDAALENPSPEARMVWSSRHEARISTVLRPEQLLYVQVSWHPGWHAAVNGKPRPIRPDGLGFMVIEPRCDGPCDVQLTCDGGTEMRLARWASIASVAIMLVRLGWSLRSARRTSGR